MKTIGVFTLDPWTLLDKSSMKTELLYFDHLNYFFHGKDILEKFCDGLPYGKETFQRRIKELEELETVGLISEYSIEQHDKHYSKYRDQASIDNAIERLKLSKEFNIKEKEVKSILVDFLERFREVGQLEARINSTFLNKSSSRDEYVPIIRGEYFNHSEEGHLKKTEVSSIIIKNFPIISNEISTKHLCEFKSDAEACLKLKRLKNWAVDLSKSDLNAKEINQKIEYLLEEYKMHLNLHHLKYDTGIVETFVTTGLEAIENILKLNLSKVAKLFFDIRKQELNLLEAENNLIGKEVAYIHHLHKNSL